MTSRGAAGEFDGKTFRVVRNDGPGAEVNEATVFYYRQMGNIVLADYTGGGVRAGKLVGVLEGDTIRHGYVQVNHAGEIHSGHSTVEVQRTAVGKLRLVDSWEWESKAGRGLCILEES